MCKSRCCNRCYGAERHQWAGQPRRKGFVKEHNGAGDALRVGRIKPGSHQSLHVTHGAPVANSHIGISSTLKPSPRAAFYHGRRSALAESAASNATLATIARLCAIPESHARE